MHAKLALIDEEPISWRFAFEECDGSFDSPNSPNKRTDQQRDDTEMRDQKRKMMFAPGPTRKRGTGKVRAEQNKPEIEPRRSVNVGARDFRIEARFVESCPAIAATMSTASKTTASLSDAKIRRSDCAATPVARMNSRLSCQDRHIPRVEGALQLANVFRAQWQSFVDGLATAILTRREACFL